MAFQLFLKASVCTVLASITLSSAIAATHKKSTPRHAKAVVKIYADNTLVMQFAQDLAERQHIEVAWIQKTLASAKYSPIVVRLMRPSPSGASQNWGHYRDRTLNPMRIAAGVLFWQNNAALLTRAQEEFGVPAHIIVGILGVETIYGKNMGSFTVLDALTTLAFDYPQEHPRRAKRIAYFQGELEQLLVSSYKTGQAANSFKGSFAGAMGMPQFMPTSIAKYALDYDGDGVIDLAHSSADAIGSVANYLKAYGWNKDLPIVQAIESDAPMLDAQFQRVELENGSQASSHFAVTENFFVITRYNLSHYYAMAVIDLGKTIEQSHLSRASQKP